MRRYDIIEEHLADKYYGWCGMPEEQSRQTCLKRYREAVTGEITEHGWHCDAEPNSRDFTIG